MGQHFGLGNAEFQMLSGYTLEFDKYFPYNFTEKNRENAKGNNVYTITFQKLMVP